MTDEPRRCANPECGAVLVRHIGKEVPYHFAKRRTCNIVCGRRARPTAAIVDEKPCKYCGTTMRRDPRVVGPKEWRERKKFCSARCNADSQKMVRPVSRGPGRPASDPSAARTCVQCGGMFTRRVGQESTSRFAARECCSRPCAQLRKAVLRSEVRPDADTKPCEQCGTEFARTRAEGPKRWVGRRYCGAGCVADAKRTGRSRPKPRARAVPRNARTSVPVPPKPPAPPAPVWRPAVWIEHEKARAKAS